MTRWWWWSWSWETPRALQGHLLLRLIALLIPQLRPSRYHDGPAWIVGYRLLASPAAMERQIQTHQQDWAFALAAPALLLREDPLANQQLGGTLCLLWLVVEGLSFELLDLLIVLHLDHTFVMTIIAPRCLEFASHSFFMNWIEHSSSHCTWSTRRMLQQCRTRSFSRRIMMSERSGGRVSDWTRASPLSAP